MSRTVQDRLKEVSDFCQENDITVSDNQNPWVSLFKSNKIVVINVTSEKLLTLTDGWSDHTLEEFNYPESVAGQTTEENANGFYGVARALKNVAANNNTDMLMCMIIMIVGLANKSEPAAFRGLSQKIEAGEWQGTAAWHWLAHALRLAAQKNDKDAVTAITTMIVELAKKSDPKDLSAGLSQKRESGEWQGATTWYWLAHALRLAAEKNDKDAVTAITTMIVELAKKSDPKNLSAGLSQKRESGEWQGATAWYWLASALSWAAENNNKDVVASITTMIIELAKKSNPDDLSRGLSQKIEAGVWQGTTAWYWLADALRLAAEKNDKDAVTAITTMIIALAKKSNPDDLSRGLSQKIEAGAEQGTTAWYWLAHALKQALQKNNVENAHSIIGVIETLFVKLWGNELTKPGFTEGKLKEIGFTKDIRDKLAALLIQEATTLTGSINKIKHLREKTNQDTLLGKMLDTSFGITSSSGARKAINDEIQTMQTMQKKEQVENEKRATATRQNSLFPPATGSINDDESEQTLTANTNIKVKPPC